MSARTIALDAHQATIVKLVDDTGKVQVVQFEGDGPEDDGGEDIAEAESMLPYGFSCNPPVGSEAVVLQIGGDGANGVVISVQHRDQRPTGLAAGEVALHMGAAVKIHLKADGKVYLGSSNATDYVALASQVLTELQAIKTKFDSHTHLYAPGPGAAIASATPLPVLDAPGSVAATSVLAE